MKASQILLEVIRQPNSEIEKLNLLKDKVCKGLHLREDEVIKLKKLVKKYNSIKLTKNRIVSVLKKIRKGDELYI